MIANRACVQAATAMHSNIMPTEAVHVQPLESVEIWKSIATCQQTSVTLHSDACSNLDLVDRCRECLCRPHHHHSNPMTFHGDMRLRLKEEVGGGCDTRCCLPTEAELLVGQTLHTPRAPWCSYTGPLSRIPQF